MKILRKIYHLPGISFILLLLSFSFISCEKEDPIPLPTDTDQTVFMYFPWSSNLTFYFRQNISDMEDAIKTGILKNERVIVFLSTTPTEATLFEITYEKGETARKTLKTYSNLAFTTATGITSILNDVQEFSPAKRYGMIIGCHGMGWLPVVPDTKARSIYPTLKKHWEYENVPLTRYFGGLSSNYQTDITTLAQGISNANLKMEYILFDDCYMSTVEVAYDLKNVTHYLIASTSEIMAYGMPYSKIAPYLIGKVDYKNICDKFYDFYSTYSTPCGTIGVTNCSEIENLATIMKEINRRYTFDSTTINSLQRLDGYDPVVFFDYGDYITNLCQDPTLLNQFNAQLNVTVPFKRNTEYIYSMSWPVDIKIDHYSGITISDPSINAWALYTKMNTGWHFATH